MFTESVLRYSRSEGDQGTEGSGCLWSAGTVSPVNFQAVVMKPNKKAQKKLTETLNQMYGHLDSRFIESEAEVGDGCLDDC